MSIAYLEQTSKYGVKWKEGVYIFWDTLLQLQSEPNRTSAISEIPYKTKFPRLIGEDFAFEN